MKHPRIAVCAKSFFFLDATTREKILKNTKKSFGITLKNGKP